MKQYNEELLEKLAAVLNLYGDRDHGNVWRYWYPASQVEEKRTIYGPQYDIIALEDVTDRHLRRALTDYLKFEDGNDKELRDLLSELNGELK